MQTKKEEEKEKKKESFLSTILGKIIRENKIVKNTSVLRYSLQ